MAKRGSLTRRQVLQAAMAIVERDGLDGLTMRRLGAALKVEAMSIYEYVDGKDDLLDGIAEAVLDELKRPRRGGSWQTRLRADARAWADLAKRYPKSFRLVHRAGLAAMPAGRAWIEEVLEALREAGFEPRRAALAYRVYASFVFCSASQIADRVRAQEADWPAADVQSAPYPRLAEVSPHVRRLGDSRVFEAGLEILLGGLELWLKPRKLTRTSKSKSRKQAPRGS